MYITFSDYFDSKMHFASSKNKLHSPSRFRNLDICYTVSVYAGVSS